MTWMSGCGLQREATGRQTVAESQEERMQQDTSTAGKGGGHSEDKHQSGPHYTRMGSHTGQVSILMCIVMHNNSFSAAIF